MTFDVLAKLPLVHNYEEAFFRGTGVALKLVPNGAPSERYSFGSHQNGFCRLLAGVQGMAEACLISERQLQHCVCETLSPQAKHCFAGLTLVAAPVVVGGRHIATWIGGQVFSRKPKAADFAAVSKLLLQAGVNGKMREIETAFFGSQVVPTSRLQAIKELLNLFALHLGEYAERHGTPPSPGEPKCVALAKEFLRAHALESVTLAQVASAVHVSPYHFCRVFRTSTGMTFTEYLSRLRVERASALLGDRSMRVSEIAFATGFGSISQFNAVFRKRLGKSPSEYRQNLPKTTARSGSPSFVGEPG